MIRILALTILLAACAPVTKSTHAIQPGLTSDAPSVWVEIVTDDDKANGVYRCVDDGKAQPVCKKAQLIR